MSFGLPYAYLDAQQLAQWIKDPAQRPGKQYAIVDVRDADYEGGAIVGHVRAPSEQRTDESVSELVRQLQGVPRVVFHCTLSQVRGPKAARIYAEELERQARLRARATRATTDAPATTGPPPPPQQQQGNKGKGELPNPYEEEGNEHVETGQEVFVLRDGFQGWQSLYRKDKELVQGWQESIWGDYSA